MQKSVCGWSLSLTLSLKDPTDRNNCYTYLNNRIIAQNRRNTSKGPDCETRSEKTIIAHHTIAVFYTLTNVLCTESREREKKEKKPAATQQALILNNFPMIFIVCLDIHYIFGNNISNFTIHISLIFVCLCIFSTFFSFIFFLIL